MIVVRQLDEQGMDSLPRCGPEGRADASPGGGGGEWSSRISSFLTSHHRLGRAADTADDSPLTGLTLGIFWQSRQAPRPGHTHGNGEPNPGSYVQGHRGY